MKNQAHFTVITPATEERLALAQLLADLDSMVAQGWMKKEGDGTYTITDAGWDAALGTETVA